MIFALVILATLMFHHLVIGGALVLAVLLISRLAKPSPELKCMLWTTAFIVATIVPLCLIQTGELPLESNTSNISKLNEPQQRDSQGAIDSVSNTQISKPSLHIPAFYIYQYSEALLIFIGFWALGSLHRSIGISSAAWRTRTLLFNAKRVDTKVEEIGLIPTVITPKAQSPMVVGLVNPTIVLPTSLFQTLDLQKLTPILLHELAHIQRKDLWVSVFQEMLAILFWWSPVMRFINAKIHINRELSCDLHAMRAMNSPKKYAQSLLDCTRLMLKQQRNLLAMSLFSKKKDLVYRIDEVLDPKHKHGPTLWKLVILSTVFGVSSLAFANQFTPSISVAAVSSQAKQFEQLPERVSEKIVDAIKREDYSTLSSLFNEGVDINVPVFGEGTALMIAIKEDKTEIANWLLDNGADPNQASLVDGNPLIVAVKQDNTEMVATLIALGADVNANVLYDETPLINASRFASLQTVELLVDSGADVNLGVVASTVNGDVYRSPINVANNTDIQNYLIAQGAK